MTHYRAAGIKTKCHQKCHHLSRIVSAEPYFFAVDGFLVLCAATLVPVGRLERGKRQHVAVRRRATAFYYYDLTILAKIAALLHKDRDAQVYEKLAQAVRAAFNAKLFHGDAAAYDRGSQTANAMALVLGLVAETH